MVEPTAFRTLVDVADGVLALLACLLLLGAIPLGVALWRVARRTSREVTRLSQQDVAPLLHQLGTTARNLAAVSATVRQDAEAVHTTATEANERVRALLRAAERRVGELDAVLRVVQDEAEDVLLTAVAAARGVRAGASVLGNMVAARGAGGGDGATRSRRSSSADSVEERAMRDEETETYDSGEFGDGDERRGKGRTSGPRPRIRSRRRDH